MNAKPLLIAGLVLAGAGIMVGLIGRRLMNAGVDRAGPGASSPLTADAGWENVLFPDFSLVDQDNKAVDQTIFDGNVTIVDFIFTSCPLQCPAMTGSLWSLSEELKGEKVRFLSMSIDPAHDTPARLKKYAADYSADPQRWLFVTGENDLVRKIVRDSLSFEVSDNPDSQVTLADGSTMPNIVHPPHFVLVGPNRHVLGIFYYQDQAQMDRLKERVHKIAATLR